MRDGGRQLTAKQGQRGCLFFAGVIAFAYLAAKAAEWLFGLLSAAG